MIALLGVVTINTTFSFIDNDILGIEWDYKQNNSFQLSDNLYPLIAKGINEKNYPAGAGNGLVWSVRNKDITDTNVYAEIVRSGTQYYLKTLGAGEVVVTCSNEKGNVSRSMNVQIFTDGIVEINLVHQSVQTKIDETIYMGEYDLKGDNKISATFKFTANAIPSTNQKDLQLYSNSDNIKVDLSKGEVEIIGDGEAYFTIGCGASSTSSPKTYSFTIVDEGVNVYTYTDLLNCTNKSKNGEIVVLQNTFESKQNMYEVTEENEIVLYDGKPNQILKDVQLFGNLDFKTDTFSFDNEVHHFPTTYNSNFITQWNKALKASGKTDEFLAEIYVGLWIRKNFYGNGHTINLHNLAYPSKRTNQEDISGNSQYIPELDTNDIFRGPLPFYSLGDPNGEPLVEALGQDNIGFYIEGDDITVNDVHIKNCDFGNMLSNLNYTGTVVEVYGDNNKIINSRLQNGRNVLRSYSSINLTIDNSMLSNARNFLIMTGSNEYYSTEKLTETYLFKNSDGTTVEAKLNKYLTGNGAGDTDLNKYLLGSFENKELMKDTLLTLQNVLNNENYVKDQLGGSMIINDTLFATSGVASIGIDTYFNGSFLYNGTPSLIQLMLEMLSQIDDQGSVISIQNNNISGASYPVHVDICGSTKFYDYKTQDGMDISGLIDENISNIAGHFLSEEDAKKINIDQIFPIKSYLFNKASSNGALLAKDEKKYINVPVAFYGGGINLSTVNMDTLDIKSKMTSPLEIDLLDRYLDMEGIDFEEIMDMINNNQLNQAIIPLIKNVMLKCVTIVIGYEPFEFICYKSDDLLNSKGPQIEDLILNTKGVDKNEENN